MCQLSKTNFAAWLARQAVVTLTLGMAYATAQAAEMKLPITFSGGHEIGRKDYGRPVALIAAALQVETDVFREAFSGVTPARGGGPSPDEARRNKSALMKVLAPHGVTNDRLDEVSNYYRYRRQSGEIWPTAAAKAYAVVVNGKIKKIVVTEPGSGYCNPPTATVNGLENVSLKVTLHFDTQLEKNGGIASVELSKSAATTDRE
jgi:hypothetical protein